jgi:hypothetical protein
MWRRFRWILLVLFVAIAGGATALVVIENPKLDDSRSSVDRRWIPLRVALVPRYEKLDTALGAFDAAGGTDRAVSHSLHAELKRWLDTVRHGDANTQVQRANALEAQSRRLSANVFASERLRGVAPLNEAIAAFAAASPGTGLVTRYNRAVRQYEHEREGTLQRPVARVLGYDARPVFVLGT